MRRTSRTSTGNADHLVRRQERGRRIALPTHVGDPDQESVVVVAATGLRCTALPCTLLQHRTARRHHVQFHSHRHYQSLLMRHHQAATATAARRTNITTDTGDHSACK
ncbi:hypothetical protein PLESTB_000376700 [Pleodorina starrii]|uniref:Uncharacterized protein n=1 Tax=Pleodorina starrii TaxID=330485 RepID=A0A9W6EYW3_9CHLO|nr:hypothetical protein PLESTB_000376700 [Pleodorina starrii]GLC64206.1 hypothetical protein PLESTF_000136000 [Pleodorina starrii]